MSYCNSSPSTDRKHNPPRAETKKTLIKVVGLLRVTVRGHLPIGPTLPSPRKGDRQDRGEGASGTVGGGAERERGGAKVCFALVDRHTLTTDGAPPAAETAPPLERALPIG